MLLSFSKWMFQIILIKLVVLFFFMCLDAWIGCAHCMFWNNYISGLALHEGFCFLFDFSVPTFLDQRKINIQEETYLDLDHSSADSNTFGLEPLDIKPTHISFSFDNESRAKDFLRLSEENEMLEIGSKLENDEDILMANTTLRDDSEKPLFGEMFILEDKLHIL